MADNVEKLGGGFKKLDTLLLGLGSTLSESVTALGQTSKAVVDLSKVAASGASSASKLGASLAIVSTTGVKAALGLMSLTDAVTTISSLVTLGIKAEKAYRDFSGVAATLSFETAILGTSTLSDNLKTLEATSGNVLDTLRTTFGAGFNTADFQEMSTKAVASYAQVEQAAYRLGTITVKGSERAIDTLGRNIEVTRELQKATNNATDSVATLNAQYDIASAGFTNQADSLDVGKASVDLSQAGFGDLGGSTDAVVKVLRALGEEADTASLRAGQLFETTKVGLLTLDQLTGVIGPLSVQSKQLGIDFSEITGALAGLTTQGLSASESATRLEALFGEITNASAATNAQLASFRDEAGKPIQLNAAVLKDKGIAGIVADLRTATGGNVANIQKLFSTKEAVEAVQLLLSLGEDSLTSYTKSIEAVDPNALGKEAAGRRQTITGSFSASQNASQSQVEDFGKGLSKNVVDTVLEADTVFASFATGSAEAVGSLSGTITGLGTKIKSIGGFVLTAFSVAVPLAFSATVTNIIFKIAAKVLTIGEAFKKNQKQGETVWQSLVRMAEDGLAQVLARWEITLDRIVAKAGAAGRDIREAIAIREAGGVVPPKPKQSNAVDLPAPKTTLLDKAQASLDAFGKRSTTISANVSKGFSAMGGIVSSSAKFLGTLGVGAVGAVAGFQVLAGNISSFVQLLDKRTNPALQEARDKLLALGDIPGLDELLADLDPLTASITDASFAQGVFNETLDRGKKLWSDLTGASRTYFKQTLPELSKLSAALKDNNDNSIKSRNQGVIGTQSIKAKSAEEKIVLGITLDSEDTKALEDEVKNKQAQLAAQVAIEEQKLAEGKNKLSPQALEEAQANLETLRASVKEETKAYDIALKKKLVEQDIKRFRDIDTSVPLNVSLADNASEGVKAQIGQITASLSKAGGATILDPEKFASEFADIQDQLKSTTSSIDLSVKVDVSTAQSLRDELIKSVGAEDFAKFIASNPQFREQFAQLNANISNELSKQTTANVNAQTAALKNAQGNLGGGQAVVLQADIELGGINEKAKVLATELGRPETTLARQLDIIAQIEQLETERTNIGIEKTIAQELSLRKQELTLAESLFNVKVAEAALLDKQSRYGSLAVSSAQLKLKAAQDELAIKKEQVSIAGKEATIKADASANAIAQAEKRLNSNKSATLGTAPTSESRAAFADKKRADLAARKTNIESDTELKLKESRSKAGIFSKEDQAKIVAAHTKSIAGFGLKKDVKDKLFDEDGRLRDKDKTQAELSKAAGARISGVDGRRMAGEAVNTILDSNLNQKKAEQEIKSAASKEVTKLEAATAKEIEARNRIATTVGAKIKDATKLDFSASAKSQTASGAQALTTDAAASAIKTQQELNNALGTTSEKFKVLEATLNSEFAARDKLIIQNDLAAKSLGAIAGNAALFGDSLAGAQLDLLSATTSNQAGQINTEADKEIARIEATVTAFVQQLETAQAVLSGAKASGAPDATIKKLEQVVADSQANVSSVSTEAKDDIAFVKQQKDVQLLGAAADLSSKKILLETKAREQAANMASKSEAALESLSNTAGFADTAIGDSIKATAAQNKAARNENALRAKGEIALINERLATLGKLAQTDPSAAKLLPGAKAEASKEISSINQRARLGDLEDDFAVRRAAIEKQTKKTARDAEKASSRDARVGDIASSGLLSGSVVAAAIEAQVSANKAQRGSGRSAAEGEIALIENQLATLRELAKTDTTAAKLLPEAEKDAEGRIATKRLEGAFDDLESRLKASKDGIEAEYASRFELINRNESVLSSFSSLASAAGNLFANSSLGATLNRVASDMSASTGKLKTEYEKELALIDARNQGLGDALSTAEKSGADPETIAGLRRAKALDSVQGQAAKASLRQKLQLDTLTQSLSAMDSKVKEVSDVIAKQAEQYKDQIDFSQRQTDSSATNNRSGTELQKALVGYLGQNNGATDIISQRIDYQQANEDAKIAKEGNVNQAKKELIDITVFKSQLEIEQRSYENALTQTMLLSDMVSVLSGGTAQTDTSSLLSQLPTLIQQSRDQASQRSALIDEKQAFVGKELDVKNTAIDRDTTAKQLGILGQNQNPANIDLITEVLNKSQSQLDAFTRDDINVGSLSDASFKQQLASINSIKDSFVNNALPRQASPAQSRPSTNVQLTSPVSISVSVPTGSNIDKGQIERMINTQVNPAIKRGMDKVSNSLLKYANTF
jgi:hypothetical protein